MKLVVTTNFSDSLLDNIERYPVEWISGRLPMDPVGGSTQITENSIKKVNKPILEKYIKRVHQKGWKFNYLLDGTCLGNKEYSWSGKKSILDLINWLENAGVDGITVTIPHLVETIKEQYPRLSVGFGSLRVIVEMQRVKYYEKLKADWIILHTTSNRYFHLLKNLRKAVDNELWLTVNSGCMFNCVYGSDHDNFLSHATNYTTKGRKTNYFNYSCAKEVLERPYELVKAPWIRPEDLDVYEEMGFDTFVINPNSPKTEEISNIIKAYTERKYDGNLLDLLSLMGHKLFSYNGGYSKEAPMIDNKALDSFLKGFMERFKECPNITCDECGYCLEYANKTLKFRNQKDKKKLLSKYSTAVDKILDGELEV